MGDEYQIYVNARNSPRFKPWAIYKLGKAVARVWKAFPSLGKLLQGCGELSQVWERLLQVCGELSQVWERLLQAWGEFSQIKY